MQRSILAKFLALTAAALLVSTQLGETQEKTKPWQQATASLMTPWAKDVTPDKVWPEYPRPQMVRKDWVNLNGLWDYAIITRTPIPDSSGNKNTASAGGAPGWQATGGPGGVGALEFNGSKDFLETPRVIQDDFTIAFWVKTTQKGPSGPWYQGTGLVDGECAGIKDDFGTALVDNVFAFGVGKPDTTIKSTTPINDGRWHHVAALRTRATGTIQIFVDGKQEATGTAGKQSLTAPPHLAIGRLQTGINPFQGSLADLRIYQRPLAVNEIEALKASPGKVLPSAQEEGKGTDKGLVSWYRFQESPDISVPNLTSFDGKILVPFPVESALSGVKLPLRPYQYLYYHRKFTAPDLNKGKRLLLNFGAVDWEAKVYVNGKFVGEHRGGYDAFTIDITEAVKNGENDIVVIVYDPTGGQRGKQRLESMFHPGGIFYTPCSGIWQTVWLEAVPARRIDELEILPDIDAGVLRIKVHAQGQGPEADVEVAALEGNKEVAGAKGKAGMELVLSIPKAHLWTPDDPFLYDLKVTMGEDQVASYFGMRKISLGKDEKGITRIMLNNKFVFQAGTLDQGFWPDGIYLAPTDEALRFDVEMMRKIGLNMARKHVKIEPARWYYWCDKLGLLVWQDMPSGDISKRGEGKESDSVPISEEAGKQFKAELKAMIQQHRNHPSIIMWVVFNEGWGQHNTVEMTDWVKKMDPSRLVNNASGWTDRKCGDVIDMHNYPGPGSPKPEPTRAAVLGEFGGLGLAIPGHTWTKENWGYRGTSSPRALTRQYVDLWRKVWQLKDDAGLSAVVYTQWTDVETECNGLYTYDRKVLKVDAKQVLGAHTGNPPPPTQFETILPTAKEQKLVWRHTSEKPADNWMKADFDDKAWKEGPAGFGKVEGKKGVVGTPWNGGDIWLRKQVELPQGKLNFPALKVFHDGDVEVFINGVLATQKSGSSRNYEEIELRPESQAALRPGANVIAVHCRSGKSGQYIDVGLVQEK